MCGERGVSDERECSCACSRAPACLPSPGAPCVARAHRPIPGIVSGHGGNFISFVQNYVRCNFTEGDMAPIDYVTEAHPCIDQKEWCNNGIHNVDVRLTTYETGHIQIWDKHEGWVFVSPKSVDETHLRNLGATVCRALNFEEVRTINGHHGEPDYPAVYLDKYRTPKKLVKCSAESVSAKSMSVRGARGAGRGAVAARRGALIAMPPLALRPRAARRARWWTARVMPAARGPSVSPATKAARRSCAGAPPCPRPRITT